MADQGIEGFLRRQRIRAVKPYLSGRILNVGCGSGALAALVSADHYLGVDLDEVLLSQARRRFANYRFVSGLPEPTEKFDSHISLAVIEYISIPAQFLRMLAGCLNDIPILKPAATSLHLLVGWIHHNAGSAHGLFSKHADDENKDLLIRAKLATADNQAGLKLMPHHIFLFGANRIAVYAKDYL